MIRLPAHDASCGDAIDEAVTWLNRGEVVAVPTETFYGLAARPDRDEALAKVALLKGRDPGKAFPFIVDSVETVEKIAQEVPACARQMMQRHWPGPLTVVLKCKPAFRSWVAPYETIAVRVSSNQLVTLLAKRCGGVLCSTSANRSEQPPATSADQVVDAFPDGLAAVLDAGKLNGQLASTIVDVTSGEAKILRQGAISLSDPIQNPVASL